MTARKRKPDETYEQYRAKLKAEADLLRLVKKHGAQATAAAIKRMRKNAGITQAP